MSFLRVPQGMTRRHFMTHVAGASAMVVPAMSFTNTLMANATDLRRRHKSCIMLWMGGGPATIDMWDLKPGAPTGGEFKPIATSLPDLEIPPFVPVGGGSEGPGFLGMTWAPFVVSHNGDVRDLRMGVDQNRLAQRMKMLDVTESSFMAQVGGGDVDAIRRGGPTTPA